MWEDFNIYGAQGGDNSDSPETNAFDRYTSRLVPPDNETALIVSMQH